MSHKLLSRITNQEKLLSDRTSRWELLAMLGAFGSCISGIQALVLERDQWWGRGPSGPPGEEEGQQQGSGWGWGPAQVAAMAGFAVSLYLFYVLVPRCVCQNWI